MCNCNKLIPSVYILNTSLVNFQLQSFSGVYTADYQYFFTVLFTISPVYAFYDVEMVDIGNYSWLLAFRQSPIERIDAG